MFIDSFIGFLRVEKNYSQHTLRAYADDIRSFRDFVAGVDESLPFVDADADMLRAWIASLIDKGAAPASVSRKMSALRSFYDYLRAEGVVDYNPATSLKGPKLRKRLPVFVKEGEMDSLLDDVAFGDGYDACRDRMIIMCFYSTGMRLSELVGLDLCDVDLERSVIKVFGKRSRERIIPYGKEMESELKAYLEQRSGMQTDSKALFLSGNGGRISHSYVYRMVRERLAQVTSVGKKSPHVLRHSFATAMLNNDAELGVVKELLGHRRLATTEVYTHLTFEELKRFYKKAHPRAGSN
jgi:integrase/recombinase XerC